MRKIENECCDCAVPAYPCLGSLCPKRNVVHIYCDDCGEETELYDYDGAELCKDCIFERLDLKEITE